MARSTTGAVRGEAPSFTTDAQLMEDYLQSTGILVNLQEAGAGQVAPFRNAQGQSEAIVIDPDGVVFHVCREPLSDSGWNMYGIGAGFSGIAAVDSATVWACGTQGDIWRGDHGRWSRTTVLGSGNAAIGVSAGVDGTIWATDTAGTLFVLGETTLDAPPTVDSTINPVLVTDSAGLLNLFCVDADGAVWTIRQRVVGGSWGTWQNLATPGSGSSSVSATAMVVAPNADGRLQLFMVGADAALHTMWQQRAGGDWSGWSSVAPQDPSIATLVVAANHDGRIELFALAQPDNNGNVALYHIWQTAPNSGWSAWTNFEQPWPQAVDGVAVARDATGSLQLVLVSNANLACLAARQSTPGGDWTSWQTMGVGMPPVQGAPALAVDAHGNLALFVVDGIPGQGGARAGATGGAPGAPAGAFPETGLWNLTQVEGGWTGVWTPLESPLPGIVPLGPPMVATNADGRLEVFVEGDGQVFHLWQTTPGGGPSSWSGWANIGQPDGAALGAFAVGLSGVGALELVALGGATSWRTGYDGLLNGGWMPWVSTWWTWYPLAGGTRLTSMPAGGASDFTGIAAGALARWTPTGWTTTPLPSGLDAACLTVDADGTTWILCTDARGSLLRFVDGAFAVQGATLPGGTSISARDGAGIWAMAAGPKAGAELYVLRGDAFVGAGTPHLFNLHWNNTAAVSVGAGGALWLLDGSRNVWRQTATQASWRWSEFALPTSTMRTLTAARGGNAWGVANDGSVWQFKGSWRPFAPALPSGAIAQLSTGAPGTLWAIDAGGAPYSYSSAGGWTAIQEQFFGPLLQSPTSWAVAPMVAYQYQQGSGPGPGVWASVETWSEFTARQISVGADGTVIVLDSAGALHSFSTPPPWLATAPANLVQIAVVDATRAWAIAKDPATATPALHLYRDGAWEVVTTSQALLTPTGPAPQLSSAGDGTVWLLPGDGIPRRLDWTERATTWSARPAPSALASAAAVNVDAVSITAPQQQQAWATTMEGALRRNFGEGGAWLDTQTALPGGAAAQEVSVGTDGAMWAIDAAGALYGRRTWSQAPTTLGGASPAIAAALDSAGTLFLFTLDAQGTPWSATQRSGAAAWSDWQALPTSTQPLTTLVAAPARDGLVRVVGLTGAGVAMIAAERSTTPAWGPFARLGSGGQPSGVPLAVLATGRDSANRLHVFALGSDGSAWTIAEGPTGAWGSWASLSAGATPFVAIGATGSAVSGALVVVALDQAGVLHGSAFRPGGAGSWSPWQAIAGGVPSGVTIAGFAVGAHRDGTLRLVASGSDARLYASSAPGSQPSTWSGWVDIGAIAGVEPQSLAAAAGAGGALTCFMCGGDGAIYLATLAQSWSAWAPLGAVGAAETPMLAMAAAGDAQGVLHVAAAGAASIWRSVVQASSPTGWSDWSRLSGMQSWQPVDAPSALLHAPAGSSTALWAAFSDGSVRRRGADGTWQAIAFPSAPAPQRALGVSVGTDGAVWAVSASGCYRLNVATIAWSLAGPGSFTQPPVGRANDLWTVDAAGTVWRSVNAGATWWQERTAPAAMRSVSACADGSIWAVDRSGVAWLAAAWQRIMRPTGMPGFATATGASEVAAGHDENGVRYLFLVADGALYFTFELAHHAWLSPSLLSPPGVTLSGIATTNQQDTGALILYSAPATGVISMATKVAGQQYQFGYGSALAWSDSETVRPLMSPSVDLVAVDAATWIWFVVADLSLAASSTPGSPPQAIFAPVTPTQPFTAGAMLPLPWRRGGEPLCCAVVDLSNQLWLVGDVNLGPDGEATGTSLPLTGAGSALVGGASAFAALLQAETWAPAQPRLYAVAANTAAGGDPALWMMGRRNRFASVASPAAWGAWTPLGDTFVAIYGGPVAGPADTLFAIGAADTSLAALAQNPTTGAWSSGTVKRPSQSGDDLVSIATYQSEATLLDANGIAMAHAPVTLFAEWPLDAWVNSTLLPLGPIHGVTVRTDALGRVAVRTVATRLHAPGLTLVPAATAGAAGRQAAGGAGAAGAGTTIAPSQRIYTFFQGTGKLPIGGAPPTTLTPQGLQSLNKNLDLTTAQHAVNGINTISGLVDGAPGAAMLPWRLRDERLHGHPGSVFSDAWDHLKHAGEAIAHAVEKGIVKAVVSVEGDVVTITVKIGDDVVAALSTAIRSVEDAARAIEVLMRSVVTDIEGFIAWLKLLFDWSNIVATQDAMIGFIGQAIELLEGRIAALEGDVATIFGGIQGNLDSALQSIVAAGSIGGFGSLGALPTSVTPASSAGGAGAGAGAGAGRPGAPVGGVVPAQPVAGGSNVHQNWFVRKVLDHVTPAFALPAIDGVDASTLLDHLDLENVIGQISQAAQDVLDFLSTLFAHPSELAQQGVADLLGALEALLNALIDLIVDLVEAFLGLAKAILAGLLEMLNTRVHIPLVDTLFELIDRKPMTLMNLGTLVVAAPMYIVFETIYPGARPPFEGLPAGGAGAPGGAPGGVGVPQWTPEQQWAAGFLAFGLVNWAFTGASDIEAIVATPEADPSRVPVIGPVLVLVNSIAGIMMRISGWPGPGGFPNLPSTTPTAAEVAAWFNSAVLWGPPLLAVAASGVPALGGDVKQVVRTIMGGAATISGLVAAVEGLGAEHPISGETAAQLVVTPIGLVLSWLMISEIRQGIWDSSEETFDPAWIILVVDLIDNLAGPILHEVSAMKEG